MADHKQPSQKMGFIHGGKQPDDGGQNTLDRFNPYSVFAGSATGVKVWEEKNNAMAHIVTEGEPGVTPMAVFIGKATEGADDWAVYALAPYVPSKPDGIPFVAIPLGHGRGSPVTAISRVQHLVAVMTRAMFSTAVLETHHDAGGALVAAVVLGNAFGRDEEGEPFQPHTMYYPVGITEKGVKLLVPSGQEDSLPFPEASALAEEFFRKVTQA